MSLSPTNAYIFENGTCLMTTRVIGSDDLQRWVKKISRFSGQPVDWHWLGGDARILALGDCGRVKEAIVALLPEHDQLYQDAVWELCPAIVGIFPVPRPDWFEAYQQTN